jgi:hypothetical protein
MAKVTITKLGVGSVGRVVGVYQAIVGLVIGVLVTINVRANTCQSSTNLLHDLGISAGVAAFSIILFPLVGFVVGWVEGVVVAFILNVIFAEAGGIEYETK